MKNTLVPAMSGFLHVSNSIPFIHQTSRLVPAVSGFLLIPSEAFTEFIAELVSARCVGLSSYSLIDLTNEINWKVSARCVGLSSYSPVFYIPHYYRDGGSICVANVNIQATVS